MRVEYLVDYATFVLFPVRERDVYLRFKLTDMVREKYGWFGYSESYRHEKTGAMLHRNPERPDMGICWRFSGSTLAKLSEMMGTNNHRALLHLGLKNERCSRLDLTVDVFDDRLPLVELLPECERYNAENEHALFTIIRKPGRNEGITINRYRREYRKYLRVYDRYARHGGEAGVTRIEAEFKKPLSQTLWAQFGELEPPYNASTIVRSAIKSVVNFEHAAWKEIFDGVEPFDDSVPEKETNTLDWLITQVAPTLARSLLGDGEPNLNSALWNAVKTRLYGYSVQEFDETLRAITALEQSFLGEDD